MARFSQSDPTSGGGTYWTDGWDGYPAARQRLLDGVAQRKLPGVVVLGGDVHYGGAWEMDWTNATRSFARRRQASAAC